MTVISHCTYTIPTYRYRRYIFDIFDRLYRRNSIAHVSRRSLGPATASGVVYLSSTPLPGPPVDHNSTPQAQYESNKTIHNRTEYCDTPNSSGMQQRKRPYAM